MLKKITAMIADRFPDDLAPQRRGQAVWGELNEIYVGFCVSKQRDSEGIRFYVDWGMLPKVLFWNDPFGMKAPTPTDANPIVSGRIFPPHYGAMWGRTGSIDQAWIFDESKGIDWIESCLAPRLEIFWREDPPRFADLPTHISMLREDGSKYALARLEVIENHCPEANSGQGPTVF